MVGNIIEGFDGSTRPGAPPVRMCMRPQRIQGINASGRADHIAAVSFSGGTGGSVFSRLVHGSVDEVLAVVLRAEGWVP